MMKKTHHKRNMIHVKATPSSRMSISLPPLLRVAISTRTIVVPVGNPPLEILDIHRLQQPRFRDVLLWRIRLPATRKLMHSVLDRHHWLIWAERLNMLKSKVSLREHLRRWGSLKSVIRGVLEHGENDLFGFGSGSSGRGSNNFRFAKEHGFVVVVVACFLFGLPRVGVVRLWGK